MTAACRLLADGRLHLHHGPMDLICAAWGPEAAVRAGYQRAWARFAPLLDELVAELPLLRAAGGGRPLGPVARAMARAVDPWRPAFVTPMAAVAGAVADAVLAALAGPAITRAFVNNGGDIALFLTPGAELTAAIANGAGPSGCVTIGHDDPVRGIATSGWRGRSFSRGIADAVTVLAQTAAEADAAATMIANAVDLPGHAAILRRPARALQAESDLGDIPITCAVGPLTEAERRRALDRGVRVARRSRHAGLIKAAALFLGDGGRIVGGAHGARAPFQFAADPPSLTPGAPAARPLSKESLYV